MANISRQRAPKHLQADPMGTRQVGRGLIRCAATALAVGLVGLIPVVVMSAQPAAAAPGSDSDGDLVIDVVDLDDDNDGMTDVQECDGSAAGARFVDDATNGRLGLELRPSDLGMALSDADVTATLDISERFGYAPGTGAVVVTVEHANRHPGADVFIGGVNPVSDGTPTRFSFSGTLGVFLDIRHDLQWFDDDVKTLETHDGTQLTDWFQLASPSYAMPGFSKSEGAGANGRVYTITGPATVNPYPTVFYNGYSSELAGSIPNLRFVRPTTDFSFDAALVHAGLYPVINIFMYAECDTDLDGITDRLDADSDGDTCPDTVEGVGSARTAGEVSVTAAPRSVDLMVGSSTQFEVTAEASATQVFAAGSPDHGAGVPETPTYQWFVSTDDGATFTPVPGATSAALAVGPATSAMSGSRYRVRVASASNPCGVDSAVAALGVVDPHATDDNVTSSTSTTSTPSPTTSTPSPSTTSVDAPRSPQALGREWSRSNAVPGTGRRSTSLAFSGGSPEPLVAAAALSVLAGLVLLRGRRRS